MAVVEPAPDVAIDAVQIRSEPAHREIQDSAAHRVPGLAAREESEKIFKRRLRDPFCEATGRRI
jgi:hypothetical protein